MLTIRQTRVFPGPSLWGPMPVILLEVAIGDLETRLHRETPVFFDRLVALVPSLRDHAAVVQQPEGGLRRLLLDRLALVLQPLARTRVGSSQWNRAVGPELTYAQTQLINASGLYRVVYAYEHAQVGVAAGRLAVRLLNHLIANSEPDFAFHRELEATLIPLARRHAYHRTTGAVVDAAHRRDIPIQRLKHSPEIVQLGHGCYQRRILWGSITSETGVIADKIATDKGLTSRLLREAGLPVPDNRVVSSADDALKAAQRIGYPVVVKPLDASQGRGVTIDVRDEAEVREVFPLAKQHSRSGHVIVERFIPGPTYRILVINNQVAAVAEYLPPLVTGDGTHTIAALIERTNADPRRGVEPDQPLKSITVDTHTLTALAKQALTLDDVPEEGRVVHLAQVRWVRRGGTPIDRTEEIHPDNVEIARQAAMVVGLDVAGIDLITPDIAQSALEEGGAINEVNQQPGLGVHLHPQEGTPRDVGMAIVDHLFPPSQPVRVPIVAVTGTNGKTTTTRLIAQIMTTAGHHVGMTTTDGISLAGMLIATGDSAGASAARNVLRNPAIDYAVLETARGSILEQGLGFDRCDVAVVTNVAGDHLGTPGIETVADMARLKAVVPRAVAPGGASVLNADNPYTVDMAAVAGGEILFFSMDEHNPVIQDHLQQGGRAVVLRPTEAGERLTLLTAQEATEIVLAEEIPATMEGRIRVNIANALAATAAAIAQEVPLETIRAALRTFANSVTQTPGRFNVLEIEGRKVVIDYCHNLHGLEAMAEFVQRMHAPHTIGVLSMSGDRTDEHITAVGKLAAQIFDELVLCDNAAQYRRGRKTGETRELLRAAALAAGLAPDKITLADTKLEGADLAITKGSQASLVVVFPASAIWKHLTQKYQTKPEV